MTRAVRRRVLDDVDLNSSSLYTKILHWMLAPLLVLWPISVLMTYDVASVAANKPYDDELRDHLRIVAQQIEIAEGGQAYVRPEPEATRLIQGSSDDETYFQVLSPSGNLLLGESVMPAPQGADRPTDTTLRLRDGEIRGNDVRISSTLRCSDDGAHCVIIQLAQTRHQRAALAAQIISGVLLPQFAIVPLALIFVWFGLARGIAPLGRLREALAARRPDDLSPVDCRTAPEEVRPLILAFNEVMARLANNLAAQRRFVANAAHQMRTPLAGLRSQAELALRETDPERIRQTLRKVVSGTEHASRLINQLLALARIDDSSAAAQNNFSTLELTQLTREVVGEFVPTALAKSIDLGLEDTLDGAWVQGNATLLRELVANLVDNAIKYTPIGGAVTVRLQPEGRAGVLLSVSDSGPGVAPDARERIFERFYRVLGTQTEGSGLGLAIAREVAELHGGSITVSTNSIGIGACFAVHLPTCPIP